MYRKVDFMISECKKKPSPKYEDKQTWESYPKQLMIELQQSEEEGLDIKGYEELFKAVYHMPAGEEQERMSDVLFDIVLNAQERKDYPYNEPSTLEEIKKLRKPHPLPDKKLDIKTLKEKIHGAWMGRVCGCLLGKPIEGIRSNELVPLLKNSSNYPMHRYILSADITEEMCASCHFDLRGKCYADTVDGMPVDDDTNYVVLAQKIIEEYGRDFTPQDVSKVWMNCQGKDAYCTAERVAFLNFVNGFQPPESALYKNPYREWIGAQIRGDYYGYINPGNPELAAEMAFRDASISHTKNGIYGEMFAAAMIACAAVCDDTEDIIYGGLAQIPYTSRLYEAVDGIVKDYKNGTKEQECFEKIHKQWDEYSEHGWCHTIPNAMIVAAAVLYGQGDIGRSMCMAVETAFDTDCNGATVGSVLGMLAGISSIGKEWTAPVNDRLHTSIFGVGTVSISECAEKTMKHLL